VAQPYPVTDFSGGITDNIFSGKQTCSENMDNFVLKPDKKIIMRPGSQVDDSTHAILPSGNTRIGALINYGRNDKLFAQSGKQFFYRAVTPGAYSTLVGPASNDVFTLGDTTSAPSYAEWNKQLFVTNDSFPTLMKIYKDGSSAYQVRNAGLPAIAAPTIAIGTPSTNNYVYGFAYEYTYIVGTQTFQEFSAITLKNVLLSSEPSASTNAISAIPVLTNAGSMNFDTTVIRVFIYRTINNGTNLYKIGNVTNGTTTFNDTFSDASIQTNLQAYTNDGTLDFNVAPQAKYIHIVGNVGFLGYTKDTNGEHPNRLQQSTPGNPNFYPSGFTVDFEEEFKGVKSVVDIPVVCTSKQVFRLSGYYDAFGKNGITPIKIHDTAGCISQLSMVEAEGNLFWWGNDGVYMTDGYKCMKISDHLNSRYAIIMAAMSSKKRIQGKFDPTNRRVYWTVQIDSSSADNDLLICLDLRPGLSSESTFYTWSGDSFFPTSMEIFNDYLYRADYRGIVFKHDPTVFTDPRVDTTTSATLWYQETIVWLLDSIQVNFGDTFFRKFVSRILLQARNAGDVTIQISAFNDDSHRERLLKQIRWRKNFVWGDPGFVWGNDTCVWDAVDMIEQWRRFPAQGLRLSYIKLRITNAVGVIQTSDVSGLATIDPTLRTATLSGGNTWPTQVVDYYLTLESDSYVTQFQVVTLNGAGDTITLFDSSVSLPVAGTYKWEIVGKQKDEPLDLIGYTLHWDFVDQNQGTFHAGDDGGNA
jgi:hypothetical protein